jgi:hypothetical protein
MATQWEYAILTRMSSGLDTKWYVNRTYKYTSAHELPEEVTPAAFMRYNEAFDRIHDSHEYPILAAVLNILGADGWELMDDMNTGMTSGESLVLKRMTVAKPKAKAPVKAAKKPAKKKKK